MGYVKFIIVYIGDDGIDFFHRFFVAAIIKTIANWADFLDYYHFYRKKILKVRNIRTEEPAVMVKGPARKERMHEDIYRKLRHKANEIWNGFRLHKKIAI